MCYKKQNAITSLPQSQTSAFFFSKRPQNTCLRRLFWCFPLSFSFVSELQKFMLCDHICI